MKRTLILLLALTCLAAPLHAGQTTPDSAQSLYLQAGKEERSGSMAKAREIYESIIDRFPESDFAVKANDRLLALPASGQKAGQNAVSGPEKELEKIEKLLSPPPRAPLPTDPLLRRGVEAARLKSRAAVVRREEYDRLKRGDEAREGRKLVQAKRSDLEAAWRQGADRKVVEEFGMTLEDIAAKAEAACKEAGIIGECSEEAFYNLSGTK